MGVPGLWGIINPAGQSRSLSYLAIAEGFEGNASNRRAYCIGIDASIWLKHADWSKGGQNPDLRMLFFRLKHLALLPLLPVFIFDGSQRPQLKRGSKMGKSGNHHRVKSFKQFIEAFGMEWRDAPGEAEAELAFLNASGYIDAIMTDDCDVFIFGGCTVLKNNSSKLSGNQNSLALNSADKADKSHYMVYTADAIRSHPKVSLTKGGLILFALLAGGDYHKGVDKFGPVIAHALAMCGFGDQLLNAVEQFSSLELSSYLETWRSSVNLELRTNSKGHLPNRFSLQLPSDFPDFNILTNYVNPVTSKMSGRSGGGSPRDQKNLNLGKLANLCEEYFEEWGTKSAILERFRVNLWQPAVIYILRKAALDADFKELQKLREEGVQNPKIQGVLKPSRNESVGTPSSSIKLYLGVTPAASNISDVFVNRSTQPATPVCDTNPLFTKITTSRRAVATGNLLEYRVVLCPTQLVVYTTVGIRGIRPDNPAALKTPPDSPMMMWIPASMISQVHPGLVDDFADQRKSVTKLSKRKSTVLIPDLHCRSISPGLNTPTPQPRVKLDPWFTVGKSDPTFPSLNFSKPGFLFSFEDPALNPVSDNSGNINDAVPKERGDSGPKSRFDFLFEQIISSSRHKGSSKRKSQGQTQLQPSSSEARKSKRRRTSEYRHSNNLAVASSSQDSCLNEDFIDLT